MAYSHLTEEDRNHIYELKVEGKSITNIALCVGRDKSTISRELRRNKGKKGYRPRQAQQMSEARALNCANGRRIKPQVWQRAQYHLRHDQWSPEQIAGRFKREGQGAISHETLYQLIYADKASGGTLHLSLRSQKKRRKRYGSGRSRRGQIPNRVDISKRPKVVDAKTRVGDWEGDTVIGKGHAQAIVTLVERKTKYALMHKVAQNTSDLVTNGIIIQLKKIQALVQTMTFDNGREFSGHVKIADILQARTYFAEAYSSWQRGLNENTNGLLRQYYPKKSCFKKSIIESSKKSNC
jgi:IS30 family transposase